MSKNVKLKISKIVKYFPIETLVEIKFIQLTKDMFWYPQQPYKIVNSFSFRVKYNEGKV